MSLAHLLLKMKEKEAPLKYFDDLVNRKLLTGKLRDSWREAIKKDELPNIELEIYEFRHSNHKKDPRYKAESRQILEFPDNP